MTFTSILFENTEPGAKKEAPAPPAFFTDLNLDQIVDAITAGKEDYNLKPYFYTPLKDVTAIEYRQEIARDLENKALLGKIRSFAQKMIVMRRYLVMIEKLYYPYHKKGWLLEAVATYCDAVDCLVADLAGTRLTSRGLLAFREYITDYSCSDGFTSLLAETNKLKGDLSRVKYCVIIKDCKVKVRKYEQETDYSIEVLKTFEKFKQDAVHDYRTKLPAGSGMNHVEAKILDLVARLYPDIFSCLDTYYTKNRDCLDDTIILFDREIQFYVAYLAYIATIRRAGLTFCYPKITQQKKEIYNHDGFDLALARILINESAPVVCNSFFMKDKERILIVSGPNQGGKTTFARTFGQLHYLAGIGCPVPGSSAQFFLFDALFTHFEREEDIQSLRGKLQDDLFRVHHILNHATTDSIIILNEIFNSTTLQDSVFLSRKIMDKIVHLDLLCVWVTFIDELSSTSEKTVSLVSTIVPENPALRTYKIIRKPADGLAYAIAIAEKYGLTYRQLKQRLGS